MCNGEQIRLMCASCFQFVFTHKGCEDKAKEEHEKNCEEYNKK